MKVAIALAAAIGTLATAASAPAGRLTTQPGLVYTIPVVLNDKKIELPEQHLPRGTTIQYTIVNHGSRPYAFEIWKATTRPIPPNGKARLRLYWDSRGRFVYRTLYRGRPAGPHGSVTVY